MIAARHRSVLEARIDIQDQLNVCDDKRPNKQLLSGYSEIIQQQLLSNIIEEVPPDMNQVGITHYLPHYEVLTPSKLTTKLRIVYDASVHLEGMKRLNNLILKKLASSERSSARFLWLKNNQGQINEDDVNCYAFNELRLDDQEFNVIIPEKDRAEIFRSSWIELFGSLSVKAILDDEFMMKHADEPEVLRGIKDIEEVYQESGTVTNSQKPISLMPKSSYTRGVCTIPRNKMQKPYKNSML
ncbi:Zinc knuckle family protein [Dirofilaria immitis]|nr:Zinc knuckle family protein [Dirofilaria immitis]